jgi:AraC family transcriptional regulator
VSTIVFRYTLSLIPFLIYSILNGQEVINMGEIEIVEIGPMKVLGTKKVGRYDEMGPMFMEIHQHAMANNIQLTGPAISVVHEKSEAEAIKAMEKGNANLEVAFPVVGETAVGSDKITFYELPGATMAKLRFKGPYDQMSPAYGEIFKWIQENNKQIVGLFRECYINDPNEVGMENALTELMVPIK